MTGEQTIAPPDAGVWSIAKDVLAWMAEAEVPIGVVLLLVGFGVVIEGARFWITRKLK